MNDKTSFTIPLIRDIKYIQVAGTDGGLYYDEVMKVIDWEWDFYVQNHDFVNVIDEYAKLKTGGKAKTFPPAEKPAENTASRVTPTETPTQAPIMLASGTDNNTPIQGNQANNQKPTQKGLLDSIIENVTFIIIGGLLLLAFFILKRLNGKKAFKSYGKSNQKSRTH